ncbi:MAG: hypothetical protein R3279_08695 [Putridiphycobacter sp.]|nr:hypothetical protein [Putridiphycobacter sp.]
MKWFFFFLIISSLYQTSAQLISVSGTVTNSEGDSLYLARVSYGVNLQSFVKTNKLGRFEFKIEQRELKDIKVEFVQHETLIYRVLSKDLNRVSNGRLELNLVMNDRVLGEVIVGAKAPAVFFKSEQYSVADFEIDSEGHFILLTYPQKLIRGSDIKLLGDSENVVDSYHFSGRAIELQTDYRKNVHLISTEGVYLVVIQNDKIHLLPEEKDYYFKFVAPILDTLKDNIYYSNYSDIYPAFDYFQFNKIDSVYTALLSVIDEPMMEQYRAEFKFSDVRTRLWAANKEIESGIDKEVWVGAAVFSNSIYFNPLYAPLFVNNDSILVFDHYKNLLFKYNYDLSFVDSLSINYHENARKSGWEQPLVQDKENNRIFVLFERDGYTYLSLVDLTTGKVKYSRKLFYRYIEKLKIVDNQLFYIYRPFESIQKKYIYKETINLD